MTLISKENKQLKAYLERKNLSARRFAQNINMDASQLSKYITGERTPSIYNAYRIYLGTLKEVPMESWVDHLTLGDF